MAKIEIIIPDDKATAVVEAFAKQYNYQEKIEGEGGQVDNPISKAQFARNLITSFIKEVYIAAQVKDLEVTRQATIQSAAAEVKDVKVS